MRHDLAITQSRRELVYVDPLLLADQLRDEEFFVWLDSELSTSPMARFSRMTAAPHSIAQAFPDRTVLNGEVVTQDLNSLIRNGLSSTERSRANENGGGWYGYFAFEYAMSTLPWEPIVPLPNETPIAEFGYFESVLVFDHQAKRLYLRSDKTINDANAHANKLISAHAASIGPLRCKAGREECLNIRSTDWRSSVAKSDYYKTISATKELIAAGDIFQANISHPLVRICESELEAFQHYSVVRRLNPAPFSAFMQAPLRTILSTSPERFFNSNHDGLIEVRPIKGTIAVSGDPDRDLENKTRLLSSEKDRAENVMIVDLMRNDLSKVCTPDSVIVTDLCALETYEGVHHLVSVVTGKLREGRDVLDFIDAAFPGGSITGAPKLRAVEVINELEHSYRGVFCGSIGYFDSATEADFNIAIRTIEYRDDDTILWVGGGITHLSDPIYEYEETITKASKIIGGRPDE